MIKDQDDVNTLMIHKIGTGDSLESSKSPSPSKKPPIPK
jgi:hypothetical protein